MKRRNNCAKFAVAMQVATVDLFARLQVKGRDEDAKFAKAMQEASKHVLENERLEHELEMLNDDWEYCCKKLASCADYKGEPEVLSGD